MATIPIDTRTLINYNILYSFLEIVVFWLSIVILSYFQESMGTDGKAANLARNPGNMIRDPHHRQQLAEQLKVNPVTLTRWAAGTSKPRPEKLRSLLGMLSVQDREQAMLSLTQDYPPHALQEDADTNIYEIHPEFYHRVLSTYTTLPSSLARVVAQYSHYSADPITS